jgi:hypothetical protein
MSKTKECITFATQQFFFEASLLARKWQDKVENFQDLRKRSIEIIPELGSSFEEYKVELDQAGNESNLEPEGKREQQSNPETTKELKN